MSDKRIKDSNTRQGDTRQQEDGQRSPDEQQPAEDVEKVREIGGRKGPDPTRYGDWEKAGRCIDF